MDLLHECWVVSGNIMIFGARNVVIALSKLGTFLGCAPDPDEITKQGLVFNLGDATMTNGMVFPALSLELWDVHWTWRKTQELLLLIAPQVHTGGTLTFRSQDEDWCAAFMLGTVKFADLVKINPLRHGVLDALSLMAGETSWLKPAEPECVGRHDVLTKSLTRAMSLMIPWVDDGMKLDSPLKSEVIIASGNLGLQLLSDGVQCSLWRSHACAGVTDEELDYRRKDETEGEVADGKQG